MNSRRRKIVIIGGFGWRDIGDEAMPQAAIYNIRQLMPDADILMLSPDPQYTSNYHNERSIYDVNSYLKHKPILIYLLTKNRFSIIKKIGVALYVLYVKLFAKSDYCLRWLYFLIVVKFRSFGLKLPINKNAKLIIDEIASSDLLFNNGGGNINSLFYEELYKQTLTILAASFLGKPVILSGQTIGPFTNSIHAKIAKIALNRIDTITFRDKNVSMQRLRAIGINKPTMQDTADDAITLPILSRDVIEHLILDNQGAKWLKLNSDIIAILNISADLRANEKETLSQFDKEVTLLSCVADKLIDEHNAKIILLPTDYCVVADDRFLLREIKKTMKHGAQVLIVEQEYDAIKLKSLISIADIAIGVRYHFNVFATSSGVPCIGVANGAYQKTKLKGVMDLYDLPNCHILEDIHAIKFDRLWQVVEDVLKTRNEIAIHLKERTKILEEDSLKTIRRAADIINN